MKAKLLVLSLTLATAPVFAQQKQATGSLATTSTAMQQVDGWTATHWMPSTL